MFWGCVVKPGKPQKVQKEQTDVLLITNISLNSSGNAKASLFVKVGTAENILITSLETNKHEHAQVNLYVRISDGVTFTVQGQGEVHVAGYLDPSDSEIEDMDELDEEEEFAALKQAQGELQQEVDEDEDELDEEDLAPSKPVKKAKEVDQKPAKKVEQKPVKTAAPVAQPKQKEAKSAPAKNLDELDEDDLENMTESELALLEADLEGDDLGLEEGDEEMDEEGLEELDEDDLVDAIDDDDLEGLDEDGEEEEEAAPKKHIPSVSFFLL